MPKFSDKSMTKLMTCDERLQRVMKRVIEHFDIIILEGHRDREAQEKAYRDGRSKAHFGQSKHNTLPSLAVDIAPWPIDWQDKGGFHFMAGFVSAMAAEESDGTWTVRWGGHFKNFFDGPHIEIKELDA